MSRRLIPPGCHPCFICVKLSRSELLHAHSDERPSVDASHAARGIGIPVQSETVHAFFCAEKQSQCDGLRKGPKVLVQGKGVEEFVQFELEPKILGEAKLGYEEVHSPEMFEPHFGIDESGKGDFFGPLVIAGVYVDRAIARQLIDAGVQDSKRIGSDARIRALADTIRKATIGLTDRVLVGPAKYNELYRDFGN